MSVSIAVIEDDEEINRILCEVLKNNGYLASPAYDGREGVNMLRTRAFDLVLLDLMLPFKNGETVIKELREFSDTPVIVISARSMMETRLEMLRLGADDYIIKPFDINEVLVRVQVVLRRTLGAKALNSELLQAGDIVLDKQQKQVTVCGAKVSLTATELMLLTLFLEHPKKVYTKAELYETVWGEPYFYEDNTINVHVSNLRSKLKKASGKDHIDTVWGIGYRLKGGG